MNSVTSLLSIFADHLAMKSNQIAVQRAHAEPPVIARAKQFILDHLTEELSLGQVAGRRFRPRFQFLHQRVHQLITDLNDGAFVGLIGRFGRVGRVSWRSL